MAITRENAAFLCEARRAGALFRRMLTLGRQNLYLKRPRLDELARECGVDRSAARRVQGEYADDFLRLFLGVEELTAVDNSDFEGAGFVHDMNIPIPGKMEASVDAVLEAGALEHIFNFPVALANCMRLVKEGGRLFLGVPANNQLGHGFYQFSPELFYRCLSVETGFEVERLVALEMKSFGGEFGAYEQSYQVADPDELGERVTLSNARSVSLMIQARKTRHLSDPFAKNPQQSDYVQAWKLAAGEASANSGRPVGGRGPGRVALRRLANALPTPVRRAIVAPLMSEYGRWFVHTFRNRKFYTPVK